MEATLDKQERSAARMEPVAPLLGAEIPYGEATYNQIMHFLIKEARLLDENREAEWVELLTDDVFYYMPIRQTVLRKAGPGFHAENNWFHENKESLRFKTRRLTKLETAYSEDPPSRVRRFVSNMMLYETSIANEYVAQSNLLLLRNRGDATAYDTISARRDDLVRSTPQGWMLAQRRILMDQAVLGTPNLAIFL